MSLLNASPLEVAMHSVVHDYPGGAVALSDRVGCSPGTLSNKVNPDLAGHKLSVNESVTVQYTAKDYRILHAEALALNHAVVFLGDIEDCSDVELLNVYASFHKAVGDTSGEIQRALEDSRISKSELIRIRKAGRAAVQAYMALEKRLEAICDE